MMTGFEANTRISVRVITYKDEHKTSFIPLPDTGCILVLICALVPSGGTFRAVVSLDLKVTAKLVGSRRKMKIIKEDVQIWETDKNRSDFFGHERTQQGLKKVQKGKVWYGQDFWGIAALPTSL